MTKNPPTHRLKSWGLYVPVTNIESPQDVFWFNDVLKYSIQVAQKYSKTLSNNIKLPYPRFIIDYNQYYSEIYKFSLRVECYEYAYIDSDVIVIKDDCSVFMIVEKYQAELCIKSLLQNNINLHDILDNVA
jgi:hypothetical protein